MAKYKLEIANTVYVVVEVEAGSLMAAERKALETIRHAEIDKESLELDPDGWEFDSRFYEVDGKPVVDI